VNGPLGALVVLTDRRQADRSLVDVVRAAVDGGARTVLLREKDLGPAERTALADRLRPVLDAAGGRLVVSGPDPLGGTAVHLSPTDAAPPGARLTGRSCHGETDLRRLSDEDYVTVSPVFLTASKPGYGPPLGAAGLRRLAAATATPVYALGGITTPAQVAGCLAAGAAGVAVMGAVMRADDPAALVRSLLEATP
jgi:thiamine-phosphate diphosphorylase